MENQMKTDARRSSAALFEIRRQIVRFHGKDTDPMAIKEQTGISWGAIRKAIDLFESDGIKALKPKAVKRWLNETTGVPRRTKDGLLKKTTEHMDMEKSSPERVKSYFGDRHVAYAADSL